MPIRKDIKTRLKLLAVFIVLVILAMAATIFSIVDFNESEPAELSIKHIDANTISIAGSIDDITGKELLDSIASKPYLNKIIIEGSGGGEVINSINIGNQIYDRKIELEINKYCLSSCFNYFVLAAPKVKVNENAIIGFHGSPQTFPLPIRFMLNEEIEKELAFLTKIQKSPDIYYQLMDITEEYTEKNNIQDMTFWMVGRDFLIKNGVNLDPASYFPGSQADLEANVEAIIQGSVRKPLLVMYGDFER